MPVTNHRLLWIGVGVLGVICGLPVAQAVSGPSSAVPATSRDQSTETAPDAPPVIVEVQPSPRRARLFGRVSAGFVYRWALQESLLGGALEGELGARDHRWAAGARVRVEAGKMLASLQYQVVTLGPSLWFPPLADRVHFGMGLEGGALIIDRRTAPGTAMWTVIWGGRVDAALDLVRIGERGGVYFGTSLSAQALTAAPYPVTVATGFSLGYRP